MHANSLQLCPTLCDAMGYSPSRLLSVGFSGQKYWNGLPWPPPGHLPNPGIKSVSLMSPALTGRFFTTSTTWAALLRYFVCVLVTQKCLTLHDPMDCSLPDSSVLGILQSRVLEWVTIPFSRGSSQPRYWTQVSSIAGGFFTVWGTREALLWY